MKVKFVYYLITLFLLAGSIARADEGMWLPVLISKYNIQDMQKAGLKLTAEQIYSVNQACLKDAVITLDHGGCTGSIISGKGLLITNHHCGFDDIAGQSSVEHNYLNNGFWAMRQQEELPIPGKSVSFLVRMEDVTAAVLSQVHPGMKSDDKKVMIGEAIDSLTKAAIGESHYEATVESMFEGNEYYLFVYETFKDIRMVGAPPSGIGKFGGETDNWMWPRHTGDFCLLRVYADAEGKPADYSSSNKPYQGKYFLPVSLKGIKEGDFSMIIGYPGSTDRYLTSYGIKEKLDYLNPTDILLKTAKMEIMKNFMKQGASQRLLYASDYAYLANFQKKSIQESKALKKLRVFDDKKSTEEAFTAWVKQHEESNKLYGHVIQTFDSIYQVKESMQADVAQLYLEESFIGAKILLLAYKARGLEGALEAGEGIEAQLADLREQAKEHFKNYHPEVDKAIMIKLFDLIMQNLSDQYHPDIFSQIARKFRNSTARYAEHLYEKSFLATAEKFEEFLDHPDLKKLRKDPAYQASSSFLATYFMVRISQLTYDDLFRDIRMKYIKGLQEMYPNSIFYPDANSTMRLTYGHVEPYDPADAVNYDYLTTGKGILEKEDPASEEFMAPDKLVRLINDNDFGEYAENGVLPVCFLTTLDITGGNSGSPVFNAFGELIGVAFDGNSEAMSSDIKYDMNLQRTICVDIRYVLFIIDKFAGAGYLLDEMNLVRK